MKMKTVSGLMLTLLLTSILTLTFNILSAEASGTIYIRPDGSIDPPTAPISTSDNVTYTLTDNITCSGDGIIVERSNIVIDGNGYTLQGSGSGDGIQGFLIDSLTLTVENIEIRNFSYGIDLWGSEPLGCSIFLCKIMDNGGGIYLASMITFFNISASKIANNDGFGIAVLDCFGYIRGNDIVNNGGDGFSMTMGSCYISGNNITGNGGNGIRIMMGGDSEITENSIVANNGSGIKLDSHFNRIYHNTFENNTKHAIVQGINMWDNGYPSGGNYWSDHVTVDEYFGVYQNETGSDGIVDKPYIINEDNKDRYPLTEPWAEPIMIKSLIRTIKFWDLPKGTENSLKAKLKVAIHMLDMGEEDRAIRKLTAFINRVEMLREKTLTNEQADQLISEAQRIIDLIKG